MKAVLALAASLSLASATLLPRQGIQDIPQCALTCALSSLGSTGCDQTDFACICSATAFITSLVPCVQGACSAADYERTVQAASGLCAAAGVTLSIPPGATETGSSTAPASSSTEAPSTGSETTSAPSTTETSESITSMAETTAPPSTTAPSNATQTTGTGTRPPNATGTEPGAASRNTVALGGLGAIVALVAAFL